MAAPRNRSLRMGSSGGNGSDVLPSRAIPDSALDMDSAESDLIFACVANLSMARDAKDRGEWKTALSCLESCAAGALSAAQIIAGRARKMSEQNAKNVAPIKTGVVDIGLISDVLALLLDCHMPDFDDLPESETPDHEQTQIQIQIQDTTNDSL
jgi:hypothetical protein